MPVDEQEAFKIALRRLFMTEVRPVFREHRETCSEQDLAGMFDQFWTRFHGYLFAQ